MAGCGDTGDDAMELHVWKSGWGLPSIDPESLQILTCVKFATSVPIKIIDCENPRKSPTGAIPFFKHNLKVLTSADEIISYLREQGYGCDYGLTSKQCAEVVAYSHLVNDSLKPAVEYFSWIHTGNFMETIRVCYGERLPWLYKMWYPDRRLRKKAVDLILVTFPEYEYQLQSCEPYVIQKASDCIKLLSDKLGTNDFIMVPDRPTSLDALIFSFVAPLLKIPLGHCPLKEVIRATPNLERYVARITHHYFVKARDGGSGDAKLLGSLSTNTNYGSDGHPTKNQSTASMSAGSDSSSSSHFVMNQKVFTFFAVGVAMLSYAFRHGMIYLPARLGSKSEVYYEDDYDEVEDENAEFWDE